MLCVDAHARHSTGSSGRTERTIAAFHDSAALYYEQHLAPNAVATRVARAALDVRKRMVLRRHAHREAPHERPVGAGSGERRVVVEALAARSGGTVRATIHLARHLAVRPEVASVVVLTRRGSLIAQELSGEPSVRCITLSYAARAELLRRAIWQFSRLPGLLARERCDVLISMSGMLPRPPGCPVVCLMGNSLMYESHTPADALRRWAVRRTARDAAHLLAPSRAMAELVAASTGRPCDVAPLGVDRGIFSPAPAPGAEILCVADFYPHKRHDLLLDAWLSLPSPRPRLRLIGDPTVDARTHADIAARIDKLADAGSVVIEHGLAQERVADAYRRARLFVLPSEHESFCMPLAESMACGVPPVVRGLASMRETGGAGARYIDEDDPALWGAAMRSLIESDADHQGAREAAISVAGRFSWETFAENLARRL
jgi:glycosyltransferase involved in cell wall biosynthesis